MRLGSRRRESCDRRGVGAWRRRAYRTSKPRRLGRGLKQECGGEQRRHGVCLAVATKAEKSHSSPALNVFPGGGGRLPARRRSSERATATPTLSSASSHQPKGTNTSNRDGCRRNVQREDAGGAQRPCSARTPPSEAAGRPGREPLAGGGGGTSHLLFPLCAQRGGFSLRMRARARSPPC